MPLYAVTPSGPRELTLPEDHEDATRVFDVLPRGVYEALRTYDHVRFVGLEEHLQRAVRSLRLLGLDAELDLAALRRALHHVVSAAPWEDSRVRFDVLSGPAEVYGSSERVLVQVLPLVLPPPEAYREGVHVPLTTRVRRDRPEAKTADWVVERRAAYPTPGDGYDPILVDDEGRLLEGVMSNLFLVRDGVLHTAPRHGVLPGITRAIVLGLAETLEIPRLEESIHRDDLGAVQEAFFSTSVRGVLPVVEIEGVALGTGRPGPETRRMMAAYDAYCARVARPAVSASPDSGEDDPPAR